MVCQPWEEIVAPIERSSSSMAILAYRLASRLASSNEVAIYARKGAGQLPHQTDEQGIVIRRIRTTTKQLHQILDRVSGMIMPARPFFASRLHSLGYWRQVALSVREQRFDIVHLSTFSQHVRTVRRLDPGARIVLHMHGESLAQLDREVIEKHLQEVDLVVGCSDFITDQIRRRFPQISNRCRTVYNGVDVDYFKTIHRNENERDCAVRRVLFVGRVSPEKGLHVLLEAFGQVLERFPTARLDVVGVAGSMIALPYAYHVALSHDQVVMQLARFYGTSTVEKVRRQLLPGGPSYFADLQLQLRGPLARQVSFHGQLPHADLLDIYRNADVFVFPSVWNEPFGMPIVEAMACGLPVVATRGGGIPEIVQENITGLLVERGDVDGLSQATLRLLEDDALRRSFGESGRRRACDLFTWTRAGDMLASAYEELFSGAPA